MPVFVGKACSVVNVHFAMVSIMIVGMHQYWVECAIAFMRSLFVCMFLSAVGSCSPAAWMCLVAQQYKVAQDIFIPEGMMGATNLDGRYAQFKHILADDARSA